MAYMEGLGRVLNVIPIAAGRGISLTDAPAVTFVTTGADTFTLTCAATFGGAYASPGSLVGLINVYKNAQTNGSAAWVKDNSLVASNTVVAPAGAACFTYGDTIIPDGQVYVKLTPTATGLVTAILHDLSVQRGPANLSIPSA